MVDTSYRLRPRHAQHRRGVGNGLFGLLAIAAFLSLSACGSPAEQTPGESTKPADPPASGTIAPGTYSNAPAEGDGEGWRVTLASGEASKSATIAHCAPDCGDTVSVPVRMGMGGLMAEYPGIDNRPIALAIRPHGDGIEVAADWGEGMESHKLVRVSATSGVGDN